MTNQQGAPEALTLAGAVDHWARGDYGLRGDEMRKAAAEIRRLHYENQRLAALVEAQQPATHVQNPAGIEHVAGDVSKNGPGSNMAQQPSPSAAAAEIVELLECSGCLKVGQKDRALAIVARLLPAQHGGVL